MTKNPRLFAAPAIPRRARLTPLLVCLLPMVLGANPALAAEPASGTLKKIKDSGAITLGYRESSMGFSYLDGTKPVGYSLDICYRIVEEAKRQLGMDKVEIRYQATTSQNRIPLVANGTVDLECGTTTNLVERQSQVAFSPDIFRYNVRFAVRADSGIKGLSDLSGKTVVSTTGTTSLRLLRQAERAKNLDIKAISGKDHAESFLLVANKRADAFVMDDILLAGQIANAANPKDYVIVGEPLRTENQALMLRKDDPAFKAVVDKVFGDMAKSGDLEKLYNRWFTQPIPPKGININYPLNAETRDAFVHPSSKGI